MAESVEPTPEEIVPADQAGAADDEPEVQAHIASPLGLQEMGVSKPDTDPGVLGSTSATSVYSCC